MNFKKFLGLFSDSSGLISGLFLNSSGRILEIFF